MPGIFHRLSLARHGPRLTKLIGEAGWLIIGQFLIVAGGLLMVIVLTRSLGPERFGIFVLLNGLEALALNLSANATIQASMRLYSNYKTGEGYRILRLESRRLLTLFVGLGAAGLGVAVLFQERTNPLLLSLVLIALLVVDAVRVHTTSMLNATRRQRLMISWQVADVWLSACGAFAAVWLVGPTALSALAGITVGALTANVVFWPVMGVIDRRTSPRDKAGAEVVSAPSAAEIRKELRSYAFAMLPIGLVGWVNGMGDRYVIAGLLSTSDVGLYAATYGIISRPYRALATFLNVFLRPRLYDAATAGRVGTMRTTLLAWIGSALVLGGAGAALLLVIEETLLETLFGEAYAGASGIAGWIALAYVLFNVQLAFARVCHAYKLPHLVFWIQSVPAVLNILLCFFLLPRIGLIGAAYAIAASFALQALIAAGLAFRATRQGRT